MRHVLLFPFLLLLMVLGGCQENAGVGIPSVVTGKDWYYAHQPTGENGFLTYRLLGTFEPLAGMGIDGFRLEADGTFVRHTQGPDDAVLDIPGTWKAEGAGKYRVSLRNDQPSYLLTIEPVDGTTLRARQN